MAQASSFRPPDADLGVPDINGMVWKQLKTKGGRDYQVGWRHSDAQATRAQMAENGLPAPIFQKTDDDDHNITRAAIKEGTKSCDEGFICVNWLVGDDRWKDADQAVKDAGCSRYKLYFNGHPNAFSYTLEFTNTKGWSFCFVDDDDPHDCYPVDTILNGDHWVKYNSTKPTIIAMRQAPCPSKADLKGIKWMRFG